MGLKTGGRRAKSLKNRVKSSKIELCFREVRSEGCTSCTAVQQALIYPALHTWQFCFGRTAFLLPFSLLNWGARHPASAAQLSAPQFSKCNGDDRSQRLKQGGAVGAAASKTRAPLKVRSGCWEPQPGGTFPTALLRQGRFCCLRSTERSIQQSAPTPVLERGRFVCEVLQPEGCMRNRRLGHISQSVPAQSVRRCKAGRHRFVKGGKARLSALRFCRAGWRTRQ